MKRLHFITAMALLCLGASAMGDRDTLVLPVRVHLSRGVTQVVKGTKLENWVTAEDVQKVVLPEVNRIWKQANVRFVLESVVEDTVSDSPEREQALQQVSNVKRNSPEIGQTSSLALSKKIFDPTKFNPAAINIYVLPYIGETLQGMASLGGRRLVVGVWTDKPTRGSRPPQKVLLTEPEPMNIGSLGRTMAHELGHCLSLPHPAKDALPKGRIMGGGQQGYLLTPEEIAQARESARKHLQTGVPASKEE